jgi:hypothetical protein
MTLAVCLRAPGGLVVNLAEVIDDITTGRNVYVVDAGARPARVNVVHEGGQTYLRTSPDADRENNLDALPDCETLPPISALPVRRNVAHVSADERRRLRDAILQLNHRSYPRGAGPPDPVTVWFKQDQIHQATHVHEQASFLAWHRVLLNEFEAKIQEIDPTLALHYWDWTTHPRRAPDGRGGTVDLFDDDFMGSDGEIGSPFREHEFYRRTPPNRDFDAAGKPRSGPRPAHLPPVLVSRQLPVSAHGPTEVTWDERDELWPPQFEGRAASEEAMRIRSDENLLSPTLDSGVGLPGKAFERFWRRIYIDHGLAHRFIGGNIGGGRTSDPAHNSFEDPFVFLLHSNVDRLWASWQLSPRGFEARAEPAWRLEPLWTYGQLIDGLVEMVSPGSVNPPYPGETPEDYDKRYDAALARQGADAGREIHSTMSPWNGLAPYGHPREDVIRPWAPGPQGEPGTPRAIRPIDREVLRPPLYDRYTFERDGLAAAWTTLQLGRRLSTHDVVSLTVERGAVDPQSVEFVLKTGPDVWWWKGIRLPNWTMIETEGSLTSSSTVYPVSELGDGQLIFHKAMPGRRIVFRVADMDWIPPGSRLTFSWEDD